ncbi:EF-Tu/IF-2/RF-3 family GTPase [Candidatus Nitrosocosmicus agrestis]|uniref:EF-Tu/IF-2/RF-3 family GTPase n=1 Tax=Candidatus Nitrosocosmicus agrestis TaxID=2563600 RepID=UPI00122DE224|nr:EF-Tu/IF-2/RF-3 family GTPase [Candidatus Nitrosocosmicus sp. SS]KAA2283754.1 elongation factor Tu [Candidatus Nitrosocosmicus sp. SS]KAF0870130.1 elongation factor Tu [Candidatus Nitrosocosmicus sp. SS]
MNSINFVILGDTSIASELGKKGTSSDITIHDKKTNENIISYCFANTYPEKLQPLLQSVAMADYAIINISKLDSFLGEQIVAAETLGIKNGFILHSYEVDPEKIKNIIKNTGLSSFVILDSLEELKAKVSEMKPNEGDAEKSNDEQSKNTCVVVDHAFDVKGVGTVILGTVKQGEIKTYDELVLSPDNKPILVKSIQMHDDPVTISKRPSRVGLAIKAVSAKDVSRGDVITSPGLAKIANTDFQIKFIKNKYFKEEISETQNYMISVGLQIRTVKVKQLPESTLQISFEKPVAYLKNEMCILFRPDSKGMRIMGYGLLE